MTQQIRSRRSSRRACFRPRSQSFGLRSFFIAFLFFGLHVASRGHRDHLSRHRRWAGNLRRANGCHHVESADLVGGDPVVELACSDWGPYRRGHGESRLQRRRVVGNAENSSSHRLVAAAWLRAGATLVADIGLAPNAKHTLCRGPEVSRAQLCSAALYSIGHGANDAQKTMGIIASLLFAKGLLGSSFYVPFWVVLSCQLAMALGTLVGGWRIVKTMGSRITPKAGSRFLRRDRGSDDAIFGDIVWGSGVDDAYNHRRHHRSRCRAQGLGSSLGHRRKYHHRLGNHAPRRGSDRCSILFMCGPILDN